MEARLLLKLLGMPEVLVGGSHVTGKLSGKAQAILYYLAVTGQPQARTVLATLLWGDSPEAAARTSLRKALAELRRELEAYLQIEHQSVAFRPDIDLWTDAVEFETLLGNASANPEPEQLQAVVDLYRGDFLTGFYVRNAPDFETWMYAEQGRLRELMIQALHSLAACFVKRGAWNDGIATLRRLLGLEPWREEAHRQLMLLLAQDGQRSAALAQYEACRQVLAEELGVEPGPTTVALYEQIRTGELSSKAAGPGDGRSTFNPDGLPFSAVSPAPPPAPRHNLPPQPTSFIGREQELAKIKRQLLEEPDCRLLTLIGPGGIGKTRLALAAAAELTDGFPHGVYFVSLAPVSKPELMASAIAEGLQLNLQAESEPKTQLFNYLAEKQLLLVIDNLEYLLQGAGLCSEVLSAAPQVKLLGTSRERLNLQEEWGYRLEGMSFPEDGVSREEEAERYSAVRLFLERARRAEAGFNPNAEDIQHIGRICQLVGGMPLALELAAPWVRSISCREIAAEIERSLDFLTTPMQNVPERHRSLRTVLEQTWQRLSEPERAVLRKLSVFRGGCRREAAAQVNGATLPLLTSLVDKALLRRTDSGRYELHEFIRQFAAEQLQVVPGDAETAQALHCAYYTSLLEDHTQTLMAGPQKQALAILTADMDNIRAAWHYALDHKDIPALEKSVVGLWLLGEYGGQLYENHLVFRQALSIFAPAAESEELIEIPEAYANLVGILLAGLGHLTARQGKLDEGCALAERAVLQLRRAKSPDQYKEALALLSLGWVLQFGGRYAEARQRAREGLELFALLGDRRNAADMLLLEGIAACGDGLLNEAEPLLLQALAAFEEVGERVERGYGLQRLAMIAAMRGDYGRAQRLLDEDLQLRQEFNDMNGMTDLLQEFSRLAIAQGRYSQAEAYIRQGLAISEEAGRREVRGFLVQLGQVRRLQGDYEEAERLWGESLESARVANHQPELAENLSYLGRLACDQGNYNQAEQLLKKSLDIWQQTGNEIKIAVVRAGLGQVLAALDETREPEARHYFVQALQLAVRQGLAPLALDVLVGAAGLAARRENPQQALELLTLAERHPAATYETRSKAHRRLIELAAVLPATPADTTAPWEQSLDWEAASERLIEAWSGWVVGVG